MKIIQADEKERRQVNKFTDNKPSLDHKLKYKLLKNYLKNKKVLDIGCWTGQFEDLAQRTVKQIIGIDPGDDAIKFANTKFSKSTNTSFFVGNAVNLKFDKQTFDVVLMLEVLEHLEPNTEEKTFKEIYKVLKNEGIFVITTPYSHPISILLDPAYFLIGHRHYSEQQLISFLEKTGFSVLKIYKKGGIYRMIDNNLSTIWKHMLNKDYRTPVYLQNKIINEFKKEGINGLIVIAQKV